MNDPAGHPTSGWRYRGTVARILLAILIAAVSPASGAELEPPLEERFHQDAAFSPDGTWIAFSELADGSDYAPENWGVWLVRPNGSGRRMALANALWVSWPPDSASLVTASGRDGDFEIYRIALDGTAPVALTDDPARDSAPAVSPDGAWIAFTSDRDGDSEIWLMAADGSAPRPLTDDPAGDYNPAWSPDGRSLVFYRSVDGGGADQVYAIDVASGAERAVTRDGHLNTFPAYAPDGGITFSCKEAAGGREGLVKVSADGADRRTVGPEGAFFGRWSPDGEWLVFIAGSWPRSAIYTMRADGSSVRKIVN